MLCIKWHRCMSLRYECHGKLMAQSKTKNLSFILLNHTLKKQNIRMTDTFMSPVTCSRRILSHDVCKLVIEAARSSLRSVAGKAMGTGKRRARDAHYYSWTPLFRSPKGNGKKFEIVRFRNKRGSVKLVTMNHFFIKYSNYMSDKSADAVAL